MQAINKVTGVTVTADEAVIRRLGPEWEAASEPKPPAKRGRRAKSDDE